MIVKSDNKIVKKKMIQDEPGFVETLTKMSSKILAPGSFLHPSFCFFIYRFRLFTAESLFLG